MEHLPCVRYYIRGREYTSEQKRQNLDLCESVVCGICQVIGCTWKGKARSQIEAAEVSA